KMPVRISRKPAMRPRSAIKSLVATVAEGIVSRIVIGLVAAAVAALALVFAYARHTIVSPNAPTLRDFSGSWWINVGGKAGEMNIRQTSGRHIEGTYRLENGVTGVQRPSRRIFVLQRRVRGRRQDENVSRIC